MFSASDLCSSKSNNILPVKPIRTKEGVRGKPVSDFARPRPGGCVKGEGERPTCDKGGDIFRK